MKNVYEKRNEGKHLASCREAAVAAFPDPEKPRTIGRPFQSGNDSRRHMNGRKCKDAIAFSQAFARALAEGGDPKALAEIIWKAAMKGQPYAIDVILDRLIGPVSKAAVIQNQPTLYKIVYDPDEDFLPNDPDTLDREPVRG